MQTLRLKPLEEQVLVVTGASSGIGMTIAEMAAERGARVVLVARGEDHLRRIVDGIRARGGEASYVVADVSDQAQVERAAAQAEQIYGGVDTWVNNAGVSIYGELEQTSLEDARRLFDVNYFGVVHGSLAALPLLRKRGAGVLINMGSVVSERAIPLQGHYSASKHAIKGFTDALRMELEKGGAPVAVVLIKPSSINTPYTHHAKNLMQEEPSLPPPIYAPEVVAEAVLECAEHPRRDVIVGAGGKLLASLGRVAPRLMDRVMESTFFRQQRSGEPSDPDAHRILNAPANGGGPARWGDQEGHVMRSSVYTRAALHPLATAMVVAALGAGAALYFGFALGRR